MYETRMNVCLYGRQFDYIEFFFSIFSIFGSILEGFGRPKWRPKSIFGRFFCDAFFECVLASIFLRFFRFFLYPNLDFCAHSQCFVTIYTKSTFSKKMRKNIDFGVVFGGQNHEKSRKYDVEKHVFFGHRFLHVFLRILAILAPFWEARALPKIG